MNTIFFIFIQQLLSCYYCIINQRNMGFNSMRTGNDLLASVKFQAMVWVLWIFGCRFISNSINYVRFYWALIETLTTTNVYAHSLSEDIVPIGRLSNQSRLPPILIGWFYYAAVKMRILRRSCCMFSRIKAIKKESIIISNKKICQLRVIRNYANENKTDIYMY